MAWSTSNHPGSTRLQRAQRAEILARNPLCYLRYSGCTGASTEEDHVVPLSQGGDRWSYSNRRGACHHCHATKTSVEAKAAKAMRSKAPVERHPGRR